MSICQASPLSVVSAQGWENGGKAKTSPLPAAPYGNGGKAKHRGGIYCYASAGPNGKTASGGDCNRYIILNCGGMIRALVRLPFFRRLPFLLPHAPGGQDPYNGDLPL